MHLLMHDTMTRSPTLTLPTSEPTSVTTPTPSWPRMRPSVTAGTSPLRMCRSVPQIVVASILTMASAGSLMLGRSEEHTSELQSLMRLSYADFCLKQKTTIKPTVDPNDNRTTH